MISFNKILKKIGVGSREKTLPGKRFGTLSPTNILLGLAVITGIIAGYASVLFGLFLHFVRYLFFDVIYGFLSQYGEWLLFTLPVIGSIFLIPLVLYFPENKGGYGIPRFLVSVHLKGGLIRMQHIFLKIICPAITIGSGGSSGVEGPSAQIGGSVGSTIGRFFEMGTTRIKALIACGTAAGLAAQFNAPITGILFVQEVIMMGKIEMDVFGAIVIASGIATAISRAYGDGEPLFGHFEYSHSEFTELFLYVVMGAFIGVLAFAFIRVFLFFQDVFDEKIKLGTVAKMLLGSLIVGMLGLIHPGIMGEGYNIIGQALSSPLDIGFPILALLVVLKMVATSITLGSGNFGGVFGPSLFIGAMFGGLFAAVVNFLFPELNIPAGSYALIGMAAFLAATTHAPLTSIFLLFEITGDYEVIIPVMLSSIVGMMVCKHFSEESIDTADLARKNVHLHQGQEVSVLNSILVSDIMQTEFDTVNENMRFSEFLTKIRYGKQLYYPVMNHNNEFTGIVSLQDIREFMLEGELEDLVLISEIMTTDLITLKVANNMSNVMDQFSLKDIDVLPVVAEDNPARIVGMLKRRDMIAAYNKELLVKKFK